MKTNITENGNVRFVVGTETFGTGAVQSPLDARNITTTRIEKDGMVATASEYPEEYTTDISMIPVLNQGKQVSCTAYAMGTMKEYFDFLDTGVLPEYSRRSLYADCKQTDGIPDVDGTYPAHVMKRLRSRGINKRISVPDDTTLSRSEYNNVEFTKDLNDEAQETVIKAYVFAPTSFEGLKKAIYDYKLVSILITLDNSFFRYTTGALQPPKEVISGHEMVAYGYTKDTIKFRNSHGQTWGMNGDGYFEKDYMPFLKEALVMVDLPNEYVKKLVSQKELLQKIILLYRSLVELITKK